MIAFSLAKAGGSGLACRIARRAIERVLVIGLNGRHRRDGLARRRILLQSGSWRGWRG